MKVLVPSPSSPSSLQSLKLFYYMMLAEEGVDLQVVHSSSIKIIILRAAFIFLHIDARSLKGVFNRAQ